MTKIRLWAAVALLLPLTALVGVAAPADAVVISPLTLEHAEQVYGDVVMVGNGVLVCPATGTAATECLGASRRDPAFPYNNNRFAMRYADVDDDPETWNSSRGEVTLPAGARVTYARLQWSGNHDGSACAVGQAGSYPAGASASTPVRLTVGDGDTLDVGPTSYDRETGSIRYYTADADVTDAFAGLAPGTPVPVTVGNVFAPTGARERWARTT